MIRLRMRNQARQWSRRPVPWNARRVVAVLLTLACMPTLLLNVGAGRSVLLHEHHGSSIHGHVLAASTHDHHDHDHDQDQDHSHDDADGDHGEGKEAEQPLVASDGVAQPVGRDGDRAVIRGTEVATAKRQSATTEIAPFINVDLPFLRASPAPPVPPPLRACDFSGGIFGGIERNELTSLRVVVLLI